MTSHGHVTPNPDGRMARCGGPLMCGDCARELAAKVSNELTATRTEIDRLLTLTSEQATEIVGKDKALQASVTALTWALRKFEVEGYDGADKFAGVLAQCIDAISPSPLSTGDRR